MKKKVILSLILILILCLGLIVVFLLKSKYVMSNNLVDLVIKEESLTKSKATLILENYTDSTYIYGSDYSIEKKIFGTWYILIPKNELVFFLMGYDLRAKESKEIEIGWEDRYGKLAPGKYRIIKGVFLQRDEPSDIKDFKPVVDLYIGAEFIIG